MRRLFLFVWSLGVLAVACNEDPGPCGSGCTSPHSVSGSSTSQPATRDFKGRVQIAEAAGTRPDAGIVRDELVASVDSSDDFTLVVKRRTVTRSSPLDASDVDASDADASDADPSDADASDADADASDADADASDAGADGADADA